LLERADKLNELKLRNRELQIENNRLRAALAQYKATDVRNASVEEARRRLAERCRSSSYWTIFSFFPSQTLHNRKKLNKKSGDVKDT
jgi:cell shape-determining protein MreC